MSASRTSGALAIALLLLAGCAESSPDTTTPSPSASSVIDPSIPLETQLQQAITTGDASLLELVLEDYTDLEARLPNGITPLQLAIRSDRSEIVSILIDAGASLDNRDGESRTPLMVAAVYAGPETVRILLDAGADPSTTFAPDLPSTAWHFAASAGTVPAMEVLLETQDDIDAQGGFGRTALYWAAMGGHMEAVEYLLALGADPNIREDAGTSPRGWAESNGETEIAEALAAAGGEL